jgi:hypothetical protein
MIEGGVLLVVELDLATSELPVTVILLGHHFNFSFSVSCHPILFRLVICFKIARIDSLLNLKLPILF